MIYPDEWDIFNSQIIIPAKTGENRHRYLVSLKKCIEEDTSRLKDIMIRFENLGYKYTADEIIEYYSAPPVNEYFVSFCENLIEELRQIGKIRTTETYPTRQDKSCILNLSALLHDYELLDRTMFPLFLL